MMTQLYMADLNVAGRVHSSQEDASLRTLELARRDQRRARRAQRRAER